MEKVIYIVWRDSQTGTKEFARRLRSEVAEQFLAQGDYQPKVCPFGVADKAAQANDTTLFNSVFTSKA